MPYIKNERREEIKFGGDVPRNAGELNFVFTTLIIDYFREHHNYQGINDIIGALQGAQLEFYRRQVVDYENQKIIDNGDCY